MKLITSCGVVVRCIIAFTCILSFIAGSSAQQAHKRKIQPEEILSSFGIGLTTDDLIRALRHRNLLIRASAAEVLGTRKEQSAMAPLLEGLQDEALTVRVTVAEALLKLGNQAGLGALNQALVSEDKDLALNAASVLCRRGDQAGISVVKNLTEAAESRLRKLALIALKDCADFAEKRELFLRAARDPDKNVRLTALEVLVASPDQPLIDLLIKLLRDKDEVLRFAGNKWLEQISHRSFGFRHTDPEGRREDAVRQWESWWQNNKERFAVGKK